MLGPRGSTMVLALGLVLAACTPAPTVAPISSSDATRPATPPRVLLLVRHAEKVDESTDAALSPEGHARAACLAEVVADLGLTHVFATEFQRTRDTVTPAARAANLEIQVVPAKAKDAWVTAMRTLAPGSTALVAGHSNSIPDLIAGLGAGATEIAHETYDWMFIVTLPESGTPTLLRTHYCPRYATDVDAQQARRRDTRRSPP